jgi:hypothetical protein
MKIFLAVILGFISAGCAKSQEKTLEKDKQCYVIRFAEPFVKKEFGVNYKKIFQLLDVCPKREKGLPYPGAAISIERDGKTIQTQFDVLKTFINEAEARELAAKNNITDTPFLPKNDCEIIRIIDMPLTKRPNVATNPQIALLNTCIFDEMAVQRPSIEVLRLGKKQFRLFEVTKIFADKHEAEKYAKNNNVFDINLNDDSALGKIDAELTKQHLYTMRGDISAQVIKLKNEFKEDLKTHLKNPNTFDYPFFNLADELSIRTSPDKKLKFYSWDTHTGGTMHIFAVIAQYKSADGTIKVKEINAPHLDELPSQNDFNIYEIYQVEQYYLTFGRGTHGSGHQFQIVQVFKIEKDLLSKDNSILPNSRDLIITYPRGEKSELAFDSVKNEISYREFIEDKNSGFMQPTGKTTRLKLVNRKFNTK